jgi:predicted MFS family arabinose efflux permease
MIKESLHKTLFLLPFFLFLVAVGLLQFGEPIFLTPVLICLWGAICGPVPVAWSAWLYAKSLNMQRPAGVYMLLQFNSLRL